MPSISLGCVWDGKVNVVSEASLRHPGYDYYAWVDIGMHASMPYAGIFRKHRGGAWPHPAKLAALPHDKVSISHSGLTCNKGKSNPFEFWHCAAATAFVVPAKILPDVHKLFYDTVEECIQFWRDGHTWRPAKGGEYGGYACMSEQMIFSVMARDHPDMFHFIGHGWGAIAANLTTDTVSFNNGMDRESTSGLIDFLNGEERSIEESARQKI